MIEELVLDHLFGNRKKKVKFFFVLSFEEKFKNFSHVAHTGSFLLFNFRERC